MNLVKQPIGNLTVTVWSSTSGSEEEKDKTIINLQIGFPERDRLDSLVCIFLDPLNWPVNWPIWWKNHIMTSWIMTSSVIFSIKVSFSTKCQKNATENEYQVSYQSEWTWIRWKCTATQKWTIFSQTSSSCVYTFHR